MGYCLDEIESLQNCGSREKIPENSVRQYQPNDFRVEVCVVSSLNYLLKGGLLHTRARYILPSISKSLERI